MICFFTSAADIHGKACLNPANGFVDRLRQSLPDPFRGLFISSDPEDAFVNDIVWANMRGYFASEGMLMSHCTVLDSRTEHEAARLIAEAQLIVLSGGHVPTQNAFFERIGLRELISTFDGVLVSISAGTMNSADVVYAMPELEGEAIDPGFRRTLRGLGLTDISVIPHFQYIRTLALDGIPMEDIARQDSMKRRLYAINDGSYILSKDGAQRLYGEAYLIEKATITPICADGESIGL